MSNLEVNKGDEFIIGLDISGSMGTTDCPGGMTRIAYTLETLRTFSVEAAKYDPDGVSFYLFGASLQVFKDVTSDVISSKLTNIQLEPATQTHLAISGAYDEHKTKGSQQTFLLLFTDGAPSDAQAVKDAIVKITNDVKDPLEFRIAFITVGERPADLDAFLTDLDDNLVAKDGAKHDIVDVKKIGEVDFMAAIAGALTD